eukprot:9389010-Pyramimonas_sp.AAC.1
MARVPTDCLLRARPPSLSKKTMHSAIIVKDWFLTRTAGRPAVCKPTVHHSGHPAAIAHWLSRRMVGRGRHIFRCVLTLARTHLARSPRQ